MLKQEKVIKSLKAAVQFIPENLKLNRQYEAYCEFLKNNEFELALDSLIEFIQETDYSIEIELWHNLKHAAELIQLPNTVRAIDARINN